MSIHDNNNILGNHILEGVLKLGSMLPDTIYDTQSHPQGELSQATI